MHHFCTSTFIVALCVSAASALPLDHSSSNPTTEITTAPASRRGLCILPPCPDLDAPIDRQEIICGTPFKVSARGLFRVAELEYTIQPSQDESQAVWTSGRVSPSSGVYKAEMIVESANTTGELWLKQAGYDANGFPMPEADISIVVGLSGC